MLIKSANKLPTLSEIRSLSIDEVARFHRDGFLILRNALTEDELKSYSPHIESCWARNKLDTRPLHERDTYGRAFTQALNLALLDANVAQLAHSPRLAHIAACLLGTERVRICLDEAFFKEPGSGPTPWHQDQLVWPFSQVPTLTIWLPLHDLTPEMGQLSFARGSHKQNALCMDDISDESDATLAQRITEFGYESLPTGPMMLGDISIHDGWTVHRAGPNLTPHTRAAYALHFFADGARVVANLPAQRRLLKYFCPELHPGDLAASKQWRLVPTGRK